MPLIACIGDSITFGGSPSYPAQLPGILGAGYTSENDGNPGYTTGDLLSYVWPAARARNPGIVVVLGGVNDQFRTSYYGGSSSGPPLSSAVSIANLTAIYDQVRSDGRSLIVVTILPYGGYSGWTSQGQTNIDAINAAIRSYAATHGVPVFDAYAFFGSTGNPQVQDPSWGTSDGLHPGQVGTNALATHVATAISSTSSTTTSTTTTTTSSTTSTTTTSTSAPGSTTTQAPSVLALSFGDGGDIPLSESGELRIATSGGVKCVRLVDPVDATPIRIATSIGVKGLA